MTAVALVLGLVVAGALGSVLRHEVLVRTSEAGTIDRARAVALVNLVGALLVGVVVAAPLSTVWTVVLAVGLCGSATTFSTWMVEAVLAHGSGRRWRTIAALDLVGQLAVGTGLVISLVGLA